MHAKDELYSQLRGPAENLTVLATAYDDPAQKGTGEHEPILFTISYGKGRVFHTVLGHVGRSGGPLPAMECVGFITTFQRGAEWAATGKVTQEIPQDFPTDTEVRRWKDSMRPRPLDELLADIAKYEQGQSRRPLTELTDLMSSASYSPGTLKRIEKSFNKFLRSDATPAGKQFICRKLSVIGTKDSVPALAAMLTEKASSPIEPADMARYALERIPGPEASGALRDALPKTAGSIKVGIINSLGARGDRKAVKQLSKLISDSDKQVAEAALSALGKIGGRQAAKGLKAGESKIDAGLRPVWAAAYLMCADKFLVSNKTKPALAIYRQLYVPQEAAPVRIGALRGLVKAEPDSASETVVGVLKGDDQMLQAAAIGLLAEIPGQDIVKAVTAELGSLSSMGQVQVLSALGVRGDRSALPAVLEAAGSSDGDVRIAAYGALAKLGDASNVDFLAQAAASTDGAEQQAAREALYRLRGQEVDKKILAGIAEAEPKVKAELVRATGERNISAAVKTLLETAWAREPEVRLESLKALRVVAAETDLPALVALVLYAKAGADRIEAENTVAAVAHKIEDKEHQADAVLAILASAKDVEPRCALLNLLGKISSDSSVPVLRAALKDEDARVKSTAVRVLSEWPSAEPMNDLVEVARSADDERHRVLALRGYVRMIGMDRERPPAETVRMYQSAMELASDVAAKRAVLSGLANVKSLEALELASGCLEDTGLQGEAAAAVIRIAGSTRTGHAQQTKVALQKVIGTTDNDSLREQAQKLIGELKQFEDYITEWEVSGPYTKGSSGPSGLFDVVFAPEKGQGEQAQWRIMPAGTDGDRPWLLELDKALGGSDCVGYLRSNIWSDKQQTVRFAVGSNDGIKVWLNGKVVHSNNVMRTISRDEDVFEATLRAGWNPLMMKITQNGGQWSACARLQSPGGGGLPGLKIRAGVRAVFVVGIPLIGDTFADWGEKVGAWQIVSEVKMNPENEELLAATPGLGVIVNGPDGRTVDIFSKAEFADVKAHVEFMVPRGSNSGVYFMGRYEIQVFDSWGVEDPKHSDCGGIYQRWDGNRDPKGFEGHPPRVNASLPPGQWQSFDVMFRAPRFDEAGNKVANARFEKVIHNGIVVHENVEVKGHTRAAAYSDEKPTGPLMLQGDHGPVAYRNIWIVPLN
jgi:HEAT repeat protein